MSKKAIVLLSGGLDSATTLAIALFAGYDCYALSFRYGQRHAAELDCAKRLADHYEVPHLICDIDLRAFGCSALTDDIDVPKGRDAAEMRDIPMTYVPARNTIFLSFALAHAETIGAHDIFIGVNALDYSGYPDCRPEYIEAYEVVANLATRRGVEGEQLRINTPLINQTKAEIIQWGKNLGVNYNMTLSCYDPLTTTTGWVACGQCDSCVLRAKGFEEAGYEDYT